MLRISCHQDLQYVCMIGRQATAALCEHVLAPYQGSNLALLRCAAWGGWVGEPCRHAHQHEVAATWHRSGWRLHVGPSVHRWSAPARSPAQQWKLMSLHTPCTIQPLATVVCDMAVLWSLPFCSCAMRTSKRQEWHTAAVVVWPECVDCCTCSRSIITRINTPCPLTLRSMPGSYTSVSVRG